MPQNTKDAQGGKSHPPKKTAATGQTGDKAQAKKGSANSPTGAHKHGEKKNHALRLGGGLAMLVAWAGCAGFSWSAS